MVRVHSSLGHQCFSDVKTAHRIALFRHAPTLGEVSAVQMSFTFPANEIAIERQNNLGLIKTEIRCDRTACTEGGGLTMNVKIHRLVGKPPRLRKLLRDGLLQAEAGR